MHGKHLIFASVKCLWSTKRMVLKFILFLHRERQELWRTHRMFHWERLVFKATPHCVKLAHGCKKSNHQCKLLQWGLCTPTLFKTLNTFLPQSQSQKELFSYPQSSLQSNELRITKNPRDTPLQGHFCLSGWLILNFSWITAGKAQTAHPAHLSFTKCFKNSKHHLLGKHRLFRNSQGLHPGSL